MTSPVLPGMKNSSRVTATPFAIDRARIIWATRGLMNDVSRVVTPGEDAYVKKVWDTLPGNTCWMSAFFLILQGKDPLA